MLEYRSTLNVRLARVQSISTAAAVESLRHGRYYRSSGWTAPVIVQSVRRRANTHDESLVGPEALAGVVRQWRHP